MAHVMIPAREDVDAGAIHHSGVSMPSISLTGEGCEVEQVNGSSFVIKVPQPSFDAFGAITDLSPIWDALQEVETNLQKHIEQSKESQMIVNTLYDVVPLQRFRIQSLEEVAGRLQIDIDGLTANHQAARQKQTYITLAAFLAMLFSLVAVGVALWSSKA